jgi:hypothetical protein
VDAYKWADPTLPLPGRPTAHEIRAIASSYAALRQVSIDHILTQCHWSNQSIFTSTYLRDFHDLSFISTVPLVAVNVPLPATFVHPWLSYFLFYGSFCLLLSGFIFILSPTLQPLHFLWYILNL